MKSLSSLNSAQVQAIANVLTTASTTATSVPNSAGGTTQNPTSTAQASQGASLYAAYCASCHGSLPNSNKLGRTAAQVKTAISSVNAMTSLSSLTSAQIQAIADALANPSATSATPASGGSTPSPTLASTSTTSNQGASLYSTYCASCHGPLASSAKGGRTAAQITSAISGVGIMNSLSSLTTAQIQAIANALVTSTAATPSPASSAGPTPTSSGHAIDGGSLYAIYCSGCHGALATSAKLGRSASQITGAISSVTAMNALSSLTATQVQGIADALANPAAANASNGATPSPSDGATLYAVYCASCHGQFNFSTVAGVSASEISGAIRKTSAMKSLSSLSATQINAISQALSTVSRGTRGDDNIINALPAFSADYQVCSSLLLIIMTVFAFSAVQKDSGKPSTSPYFRARSTRQHDL
jgi:mono/diheme cytochrome c family protein